MRSNTKEVYQSIVSSTFPPRSEETMLLILYLQKKSPYVRFEPFYSFGLMSHPMALAPSTAADEPSSPLTRNCALPFMKLSTWASYASRIGFIISSPAFTSPPKNMNASGLEKPRSRRMLSEHLACEPEYLVGHLVAFFGCYADVE